MLTTISIVTAYGLSRAFVPIFHFRNQSTTEAGPALKADQEACPPTWPPYF